MKNLLPLLVVGILVLSGLGAVAGTESEKEDFIIDSISFSQPIISEREDYVSIELEEATCDTLQAGKPMIPVVTKVYTFPFGTIIDNVEVTFSDVIVQEVTKPVNPAPETLPVSINAVYSVQESNEIMTYPDIVTYPEERYS